VERAKGICLTVETILTKVQKFTALVLAWMLIVVVVLSAIHLGVLICHEIWAPPRFLIRVQRLLEVFGYFLLVLIGVGLIERSKLTPRKTRFTFVSCWKLR
jgi:hypothetical protein